MLRRRQPAFLAVTATRDHVAPGPKRKHRRARSGCDEEGERSWLEKWPLRGIAMSGEMLWGLLVIGGSLLFAFVGAGIGTAFVTGLSLVADRVEERVQARAGARAARLAQGCDVVPALSPRGRGDEVSAERS